MGRQRVADGASVRARLSAVGLMLWAGTATAAGSAGAAHEQRLERLEQQYVAAAVLAPDSPLLTSVLQAAASANPGTSAEAWGPVKTEVAAALSGLFTARGGALDLVIRSALAKLSDAELEALSRLLRQPVYRKFQAAMSSPAAQRQLQLGVAEVGQRMGPVINEILARHHLKEVH